MGDVLIRCDECKNLYTGDLEKSVQVYEENLATFGDEKASKLSARRAKK